jgi:hypothetical protein
MKHISLLAVIVLLASCATRPPAPQYQQVTPEDQARVEKEMCEKVGCMYDVHIVLKHKDGSVFDKTYSALPVVQPEGISVYPGQKVLFEADVLGDRLSNFKLVPAIVNPERTLSAELTQGEDGGMMLMVTNPFSKRVKIRMGMMPMQTDKLLKTSSCPIIAHGSGFELWPYPLFQVWLADFRLVESTDSMICSE